MKENYMLKTWIKAIIMGVIAMVAIGLFLRHAGAESHEAKACFKWDAPVGEEKTCSHLGKQSVVVGVGWSNSEDSGMLQFKYRPAKYWEVFGMVWTDNNEDGDLHVLQQRRTPKQTNTLFILGDDGDTSNIAFGFARCAEYGIGRGCGGLAYATNDDTANIDQHVLVYLEGTFTVPENPVVNRCGLYHLSDGGSSDENFIGCGKEW